MACSRSGKQLIEVWTTESYLRAAMATALVTDLNLRETICHEAKKELSGITAGAQRTITALI